MVQLEAIYLVLLRMQRSEFELLCVVPWSPSEISNPSIYEKQSSEDTVILEAKMRPTEQEIQQPDKIFQKITFAMQRGRMHLERLQINEGTAATNIVTISELNRHNRYIVNFHYPRILASVTHDSAENGIANEVLQLLQGGEMALGEYKLASTCHHEHRWGSEAIISNITIVEICAMINLFNIDFHDNDSIYYYVLGELDSCGCELSYSYNCINGDYIHSHLGIEVYCSYHSLGTDDYDDLIQGF